MTPPTDRALRGPADLDTLRFDERGLIPVVAQQVASGAGPEIGADPGSPVSAEPVGSARAPSGSVLMVAWANREALELALETGFMHYWSRSRGRLWKKGESSGNLQRVVSLHADCDADTVLARVRMEGPACHTDEPTCFGADTAPASPGAVLDELWAVMEARDRDRPKGSYTTKLLEDENLRLKKLGEEVTELVTALVRGDGRAPEEAADLLYHLFAALRGGGHGLDEVAAELRRRRG